MTAEQLIAELTFQNERLQKELEIAQQDIRDFETLAKEWKNGYDAGIRNYKIENEHLFQRIVELEKEIKIFVSRCRPG